MGLFNRRRSAATLDAGTGEVRRNQLAAAIDSARAGGTPAPRRAGMPRGGVRMMLSGEVSRLTGDWPTTPVPADAIVSRFQAALVARSREQAHNNDFMKAYLRLNRINIVGPKGVVLQSLAVTDRGEADVDARAAVEDAFAAWGERENCDVAGKLSWRAFQSQGVETAARDGELFARMITGTQHGGPFGFALQLLDPQRCPVDFNRSDLPGGAYIRQGIEFSQYGKPVAYYFRDDAPARGSVVETYSGRTYIRIPAEEIIHAFVPEVPGQKRGFPWMATGLFRAKQTSAMEDAAIVNARAGAAKMGFIQFKEGTGPEWEDDEIDDLTIDAEAGTFPVLPAGAELKEWSPLYPSGEFAPFVKQLLRSFSAGGGVSYPSLSQDLEGVNFSSIRHGELDARETYKERQEWLVDEFCRVVFRRWLRWALLTSNVKTRTGKLLHVGMYDRLSKHDWQARRWTWIDPRADSKAAEMQKNNLLTSPGALIRESGHDPAKVWEQTAADIAAMKAAGIPMEVITASFGQAPKPPAPESKEASA